MSNPVLLTLSSGKIPGGLERYSAYLQMIIPSLRIISRETLSSHVQKEFPWPLLGEVQFGAQLRTYVDHLSRTPSAVFSNGMHGWAFSPPQKYPLVSILHGTYAGLAEQAYSKASPLYWRMRHIYSFFEKKSAQNAHIRIVNSRFTHEEVRARYGLDSHVIEPPIDTSILFPASQKNSQKKRGWSSEEKNILFVGNPVPSKGFDIFTSLAHLFPEWKFHAVCQPAYHTDIPNIQTYSPVPLDELVHFYRAADALVFPSRYEGFGFVPLEALASGCPVISSRVGVFHHFSHENAHIVPHTLPAFSHALRSVIENPKKGKSMQWTNRFSLRRFIQEWKVLMEEFHVA